jgi:hypothetical protein
MPSGDPLQVLVRLLRPNLAFGSRSAGEIPMANSTSTLLLVR